MIALSLLLALALKTDPVPTPPTALTGSAAPAPAGLEVIWAPTYPEAVEMAKARGDGRILVELTANGCGECERQEALVIPSTSFYHFTKDKVPVRVTFSSPEGQRIAQRFGIPQPPAWIVLTTDGLVCGIQAGPTNQMAWFDTFNKTEQSWAEYRKRLAEEQKNPADLALVFTIAEETYKRGGDELAEPRFRRLSSSESAGPMIRERSLAFLASIEMDQKRIPEAERDLKALLATATDGALRERAELRLADVEIAKGRNDLAIGRLRQFRKDHSSSQLVSEATRLLQRLDPEEGSGK